MCSPSEKPATANPRRAVPAAVRVTDVRLPRRRRKELLLPSITQYALQGLSGATIAEKVGLSSRTVNRWLKELGELWAAKAAESGAQTLSVTLARLEAVYREAMTGWLESQGEVQVRFDENVEADGKSGRSAKKRSSVRTQPPRRNASFLATAADAAKTTWLLKGRAALSRTQVPLETLTEDDWEGMNDEQRRTIGTRYKTAARQIGKLVMAGTTEDELKLMTDDELSAEEARLNAELTEMVAREGSQHAAGEDKPPQNA